MFKTNQFYLEKNTEVIVLIPNKIIVYKLHSFKWKTN